MRIKNIFIIMPFQEQRVVLSSGDELHYRTQHFDDVYRILRTSVESHNANIKVDRMERPFGNLLSAIIERLASSDVVIAILAGRNPNVFYELGIRHSLRLNTIMLVEDRREYPFDLNSYFSHQYSIQSEASRGELRSFVVERLVYIEQHERQEDSPVLDVLRRKEYEHLRVVDILETRRAALVLHGLIGECVGILRVVQGCLSDVNKALKGKRKTAVHGVARRIVLSLDVIEGFTKNRPLNGMSFRAYADAEAVSSGWRHLPLLWEELKKSRSTADSFNALIADTERNTLAFLYDVIEAWAYVTENRTALNIPWSSSYSRVSDSMPTFDRVIEVRNYIVERLKPVIDDLDDVDRRLVLPHPALDDLEAKVLASAPVRSLEAQLREFIQGATRASKVGSRSDSRRNRGRSNPSSKKTPTKLADDESSIPRKRPTEKGR